MRSAYLNAKSQSPVGENYWSHFIYSRPLVFLISHCSATEQEVRGEDTLQPDRCLHGPICATERRLGYQTGSCSWLAWVSMNCYQYKLVCSVLSHTHKSVPSEISEVYLEGKCLSIPCAMLWFKNGEFLKYSVSILNTMEIIF